MKKQRRNAVPIRYRAYYIEAGLADYSAEGIGVVLVQKPALDKMMSTFVGMPVVNFVHTDKEPEELFNMTSEEKDEIADGVVAATGYDDDSGWYWADMMIWDEETIENIESGFSVSCAYDVTEVDTTGGTDHNVAYDEEVLDGSYLHMAIVPNPRYEKAWIIKNSKSEEEEIVKVKFFKKKTEPKKVVKNATPPEEEKTEEVEIDNAEGYVENEDGEQIPIAELVNMYKEKKKSEMENSSVYNMDDEVEVDGERMTVKELMSACGYGESVENAEPAQDDDAEEVVDEKKQMNNSVKKAAGKKNFQKVKNAAHTDEEFVKPKINSISERLANGKSRYGRVVAQEGGK